MEQQNKVEILGVKVDKIGLTEAVAKFNDWLSEPGQSSVATVNPEFIVAAQDDSDFRRILNQTDLATADGAGLIWAGRLLQREKLIRVTGVDLSQELLIGKCPEAKIYLLGGAPGIAEAVKEKFNQGSIVGAESGGKLKAGEWLLEENQAVIERINQSGANILLVAFGQVKQEMWLAKNLSKLSKIKIAIGVGGTFDYLSGRTKRAPLFFRRLGLEWLYRLIQEPKRWKRIWNATAMFGWLVVREKIFKK